VYAVDLAPAMLRLGRRKAEAAGLSRSVQFLQADAARLPFADGRFDCITTAFMVRNLADLPAVLQEFRRLLAAGGRLAILEITRPRPRLAGALFSFYFRRLVPLAGGLISGDWEAYRYLPQSVDRFLSAEELTATLRRAGFEQIHVRHLGPGPVALHACLRGA